MFETRFYTFNPSLLDDSSNSFSTINNNSSIDYFTAKYNLQPISKVIYDLSVHFQISSLILDLEDHLISINFDKCNLEKCLDDLHSTGRVRMLHATNFAIFTKVGSTTIRPIKKKQLLIKLLATKSDPLLTISSYSSDLLLTLDRILENTSLPLHLSNKLKFKLSLNVYNVKPYEVLFYIMQFYELKTINREGKRLLVPMQDSLQSPQ